MDRGSGARPLLPQTHQAQSFSFAPPNIDTKKNYVFVDEHNRHKRLKVMRACEGCRRRKIKCDAATTNSWPCAACVRLKLQCVPPTVNYNRTHVAGGHLSGLERVLDFDNSSGSGDDDYNIPQGDQQSYEIGGEAPHPASTSSAYNESIGVFHQPIYTDKFESNPYTYDSASGIAVHSLDGSYPDQASYMTHPALPTAESGDWSSDQFSAANIAEALGELKIDETGIAPYIFQQKKSLAEAPAMEEAEARLPPVKFGAGSTIRIPPELMPSEDQAMEYFDLFFRDIHPYVPVISRSYFYQQWHHDRKSISPLLLEAIFACAGRLADEPAQGAQWLALASKHEDSFMDVPRLSTIQALLILLKAREAIPKRGYYFRSWMTVKTLVAMAKDLELDEHYADHKEGTGCGSNATECLVKTRIWQNIYLCEMMIGGPQGRLDMGVESDSVDINVQRPLPGVEEFEYQVSRDFSYLVRIVRNVRDLTDIYAKIRKQKDWGLDSRIANLNSSFAKWLEDLPSDLQIHYPLDGSPPWLPSHFVDHDFILFHGRRKLEATHVGVLQFGENALQVAGGYSTNLLLKWTVVHAAGFATTSSLFIMTLLTPVGINFTIYSILTCTMLHLVAITSPDTDFNSDAREYFTRHMRILESCTSSWPMPEMQAQIDALREAFSADTSKPFELKNSFPYNSPGSHLQPSPPLEAYSRGPAGSRHSSHDQASYTAQPITPPISAGHEDSQDNSLAAVSMVAGGHQRQQHPLPQNTLGNDILAWNPTRIFEYETHISHNASMSAAAYIASPSASPCPVPRYVPHHMRQRVIVPHADTSPPSLSQWNTAFGTTPVNSNITNTVTQSSPTVYTPSSISSHDLPHLQDAMLQQQAYPLQQQATPLTHLQRSQTNSYTSTSPSFVSPSMWQDTVASTFDPGGLKRRWNPASSYFGEPTMNKRSK